MWHWVHSFTGIRLAHRKVCRRHHPPFAWFSDLFLDRPPVAVVLGARGSGKSFNSGLLTHCESRWNPGLGTRILGGSKSQSAQIYEALDAVVASRGPGGSDADSVAELLKESCRYRNGANVSILAASKRSVRGPHIPRLRLDEVDEIDGSLRDAAMGMVMEKGGVPAAVTMTSTWHNLGGEMGRLVESGRAGEFPFYESCTFDVLERCTEDRSGPWVGGDAGYERCPECPIKRWCHAERDANGDVPLAKLSDGHYALDSFAQKPVSVSAGTFEADYLCTGPKADGLWFPKFSPSTHVRDSAEYDPALPVYVGVDSGVFTGAVFWQLHRADGPDPEVRVFADYLSEGATAEANARAILEVARARCNGRLDRVATDPAGGARNAVGPTVLMEYQRAGLKPLRTWPAGSVADSLALLDSFVTPADGTPRLIVHPRCTATSNALRSYRRAKRAGQWQDYPEDPQHPAEDLVDALRGGLREMFPAGRKPPSKLPRVPVGRVGY